jgi:hypothetical protein
MVQSFVVVGATVFSLNTTTTLATTAIDLVRYRLDKSITIILVVILV